MKLFCFIQTNGDMEYKVTIDNWTITYMYVGEYDNDYKYKLRFVSTVRFDQICHTAYIHRYSYALIFYYYFLPTDSPT